MESGGHASILAAPAVVTAPAVESPCPDCVDSDTHPYASVAGSEVRLVSPNVIPASSGVKGYLSSTLDLGAKQLLTALQAFDGAACRPLSGRNLSVLAVPPRHIGCCHAGLVVHQRAIQIQCRLSVDAVGRATLGLGQLV